LTRKAIEFGEKKTKTKGYYAVQGHSRSSRSVSIVSPYATISDLILTDMLSRTVSELWQLIAQILETAFLNPPWGGGLGTTYDIHLGLIDVKWTLFSRCYGWDATAKIDRKSAFWKRVGQY